MDMFLTGVLEMDQQILMNLDSFALLNACTVNQYANYICSDETFWRAKIIQDAGSDVAEAKPMNSTFKEQYVYLFKLDTNDKMRQAVKDGRLDVVIRYIKGREKDNLITLANTAVAYGQLEILKYLSQHNIHPELDWVNLEYVFDHRINNLINLNIRYSCNLETIQWLIEQGHMPTRANANYAATYGRLPALKWLGQFEIYPTPSGVDTALSNGHLEILEWAIQNGVNPTSEGANEIVKKGDLGLLQYLASLKIYPSIKGANIAAKYGHWRILLWLDQLGILPDFQGANAAMSKGHTDIVNWLELRGIISVRRIRKHAANKAASEGDLDVLKELALINVYPTFKGANMAARHGHVEVLKWMSQFGIYPNELGVKFAMNLRQEAVLNWLRSNGR